MRAHFAFQSVLVDIAKADTSAGDKLFFEGSFAVNAVLVVGERFYQEVASFLAEFIPFPVRGEPHLSNEV